jgi:hypothetical protein
VTWYVAICSFPGCDDAAPRPVDADDLALCLEHRRMLFYDVDEFLRLWEERDPIGKPDGAV